MYVNINVSAKLDFIATSATNHHSDICNTVMEPCMLLKVHLQSVSAWPCLAFRSPSVNHDKLT